MSISESGPRAMRRQLFALLHLLPVSNAGTANVLRLIEHHLIDAVPFLVRILVLHDLFVLAGVARRLALMAGARAQGTGDQFAALVVIASLDVLKHETPRELALFLFHSDDALDRTDAITRTHVPEELPVVAGVKAMHAG